MSITTKVTSVVIAPLAFGVMLAAPLHVAAATTTTTTDLDCSVKMTGKVNTANQADSRWKLDSDGVATGTVVVTGDEDCKVTVTLAAWQAPNADKGMPYDQQKLADSVTKTFGLGSHKLSIKTPNCFYQLDMIRGANAKGIDGTAQYPQGALMGSLHGGTTACVTPQGGGHETPAPAPAATTELPKTGVGSNVVVFGAIAAVAGTAFQYVRRLRATA